MLPDPSPPIAAGTRLRIADILVDTSTREVLSPHARQPRRVTPKAIAVLCVLAETPGQVVGREELLARVWPDTLPTDDVLTQAVTQLRKAFGPQGRDCIETIAKGGYRLVVPVEQLDAPAPEPAAAAAQAAPPASPTPAATSPAPAGQPSRWKPALAAGLAVFAAGAVAWLLGHDATPGAAQSTQGLPAAALERPYRVITTAPGFEMWPTLSPDASMVAYGAVAPGAESASIQVQPTAPVAPRQVSTPPVGASDLLPAWSPDGREIAFARRWGGQGGCRIMVVAANGGAEREVGDCNHDGLLSFSWSPDGNGLLFGSGERAGGAPGGLQLLDLGSGQRRPVPYDSGGALDHAPRYSPDGRWIAFVRNPQLGDLWRIPAEGGEAEQLTSVGAEIRGWGWLSDSRSLVFSSRVAASTRLFRLDVDSRVVTDLGLGDAQAPAIAAGSDAMAFVRRQPRFGIHRVVLGNRGEAPARVERLFESSGRDVLPSVSPDGSQIVFGSDRTGHFELWWADLSAPDSLRPVEGLVPDARYLPEWSHDGRRVLVSGLQDAAAQAPVIMEVDPVSGRSSVLPIPCDRALHAAYLPDPDQLLVTEETGEGGARLVLYERGEAPWRALRTIHDVSQARVDAGRGRILFTRLSGDGLWQADLALSPDSVAPVETHVPLRWRYRNWAVAGDGGIEYLDVASDCQVRLARIGHAGPGPGATCLDPERPASTNGFSIDAQSGDLYLALAVEDGTDIAFIDHPERLVQPRSRIAKWLNLLRNQDS